MAKRAKKSSNISLFPFMSVVACVIGVLTLMITAVVLGQLDQEDVEAIERSEQYEELKNQMESEASRNQQIRDLLTRAQALQEQLRAAREERARLEKLKSDTERNEEIRRQSVPLLAEANLRQKRIEEQTPRLAELTEEIEKLKALLAERQKPPEEAVVRIQPSGSAVGRTPVFVECTATGIVLYEGDRAHRVLARDVGRDERYLAMLDRVAAMKERGTVVFLLRSDALNVHRQASSVARQRQAHNGTLPIIGQGRLDLSLFGVTLPPG